MHQPPFPEVPRGRWATGEGAMRVILVADDDAGARAVLAEALAEVPGWVVTAVGDGTAVLDLLETVHPSLLVLHVRMPGLSGLDVYRLLRERGSRVPVLFVTAEERWRRHAVEGPHRWLMKPFDLDDLIGSAAALLGQEPPESVG